MKVLFVVVTYNAMPWIENCFQSISAISSIIERDAFVVDNGSTDGTQAYLKKQFPWVIFQQSEKNLGFGKANNIGLQYALDNNYDYVYLLNQDAWVFPETISTLVEISLKHPDYGILSPFQMSGDDYSIDFAFSSRLKSWSCYKKLLDDIYGNSLQDVYEVERVMAAHWFMTKTCITKVGGFSPTFPHYGEDDNYSERVRYKGLKIGIVPRLRVVHDRQWRKVDKKKRLYQNYTEWLFRLSSPFLSPFKEYLNLIRPVLSSVIRNKSYIPLSYFWQVTVRYRRIVQNRKESMEKSCSFLNANNK